MFNSPLRETAVVLAAATIIVVVRLAFACFFSAVWLVGFEVVFVLVSSKTLVGGHLCIIVATRRTFSCT